MSESTEEVTEEIDDVRDVNSGPGFGWTSPDSIRIRRTTISCYSTGDDVGKEMSQHEYDVIEKRQEIVSRHTREERKEVNEACGLERSLQLQITAVKQTREAVVTGYKSKLVWRRGRTSRTDSDGGRDRHVSLVSYRSPQAG
ncbi:hypothetical protein DPMN_191368 [Dreissena polymorpha]|uniref:Uncharacterized protein n=1 Tax=Dreissena polymorpha TaxID=45954 RepID=A0A9D4BE62_DREPO|nr:hypothetical protein DPMN_191368 [Dreissena polymorpha]